MSKMRVVWLTMVGMIVADCMPNGVDNVSLNSKAVPVIIRAEQIFEGETKTVRNADKSVSWLGGEEINVICGADRAKFTSTNTDAAAVVSFSGNLLEVTVEAVNNGTSAYPVWGLYPYDENVESDGETYVTTTLPATQTGVAGTFADDLFITLAKSDDFNLSFYNVCSGFKFTVTKAGITSITIQGKNDEYIAGKVKLSMGGDGKPKVDEIINGQKTITLTPEKSTFEVGKDYYFVTLPTPFTSGFTVTFITPSETGSFEVATSVTFPRSKFVTKANVDENIVYGAKAGNIIIPDANFKAYCVTNFDKNGDGEISFAEALLVTRVNCSSKSIQSLSGIEYFVNLTSLTCRSNQLTNLDVSKNTELTSLECSSNQLMSLDLSNNTSLTALFCSSNQLMSLDVSKNTELTLLHCYSNQLTSLDVSKNTSLLYLECYSNQLMSLDVSKNTELTILDCDSNQLTSLDVSKNTELTSLECSSNQLTSLDVSKNFRLQSLYCSSNQLTSLDVSKNKALTELFCSSNQLTSLDVNNNTALIRVWCNDNQLTSLDVSKNTALIDLICSSNQLTRLDVTRNTALSDLDCRLNNSSLVIQIRPGQIFFRLDRDDSAIIEETGDPIPQGNIEFGDANFKAYCVTDFDKNGDGEISFAEALLVTTIDCSSKSIQSLSGIEYFVNLTSLTCYSNQLSSLDVSKNIALTMLICDSNQLTSLDVSKNTALTGLSCQSNQLTSLDVSENTALMTMLCNDNPYLTEIWLKTGQTIEGFNYDIEVATIKYK